MTAQHTAAPPSTPTPRRPRSAFSVTIATVIGVALLLIVIPNLGPVVRAARAEGSPGTFTAVTRSCVRHPGHVACSWSGTFDPSTGGAVRQGIHLYGDPPLRTGQRIAAIDVGRRSQVYAGASHEWILTGILLLAGVVFLFPLARVTARIRPGRRHAQR